MRSYLITVTDARIHEDINDERGRQKDKWGDEHLKQFQNDALSQVNKVGKREGWT